ncbi:HTH domain-containing protein [Nocardioides exalbidus]|uniref:HTH domain-containing protein n=1 Tax=Nocardioides exalbidus TaxID=402596 RepID=A0A1H4TLT8_9ACTN|nr:WYL domain-containing protein [Nocardioides exalbidus]SEC57466.1 HTH domain-containing protein [Nocardioides exalbidus]
MPTTSSRLLTLLSLLQARRDWPGAVLAERLDVSPRTVRRDVDRLRELGYRIATFKGPDGGYRLDAGSDLPPLLFDDDQALALALSLEVTAVSGAGVGDGMREAALRALTTLRQVMPSRLRHRLETLPVTVVLPPGRSADVAPEVLHALGAAVHGRVELRMDYGEGEEDRPSRRVEPHHLVTWRDRWYLVAWDLDRADWRTFRADRITPRTPTGPRFTPRELPGGDVETFLIGRFRGQDGPTPTTDWPCTGTVLLDLPLRDVTPYTSGVAEDAGDGRTRVTQGAWSWPALAASLLRYDASLEVVDPPELREAFGVLAARCGAVAGA